MNHVRRSNSLLCSCDYSVSGKSSYALFHYAALESVLVATVGTMCVLANSHDGLAESATDVPMPQIGVLWPISLDDTNSSTVAKY